MQNGDDNDKIGEVTARLEPLAPHATCSQTSSALSGQSHGQGLVRSQTLLLINVFNLWRIHSIDSHGTESWLWAIKRN